MNSDHIKMYNHPKIQEGWKPKVGDRYWSIAVEKIYCVPISLSVSLDGELGQPFIFLPSIEQMAEMWGEARPNGEAIVFLDRLQVWESRTFLKVTWPLHIIVLAFIQYEFHGLVWSDEKEQWI